MHKLFRMLVTGSMVLSVTVSTAIAQSDDKQTRDVFAGIVFACGAGHEITANGQTKLEITDSYVRGLGEGNDYVYRNRAAIFSGIAPDQLDQTYDRFVKCVEKGFTSFSSAQQIYHPGYDAPSEREMRAALEQALLDRGAIRRGNGLATENFLAGAQISILDFRKQDCRIPQNGSGWQCTYLISTGLSYYSNEGTSAGDRHANALNQLFGLFGANKSPLNPQTRRFIKSNGYWVVGTS